ncbi:MAG: hypothetical protein OXG81_00870 [Acidobacteria bacterium]|nr:hypothetical protein [Acidobacteriota bacterium]
MGSLRWRGRRLRAGGAAALSHVRGGAESMYVRARSRFRGRAAASGKLPPLRRVG